MDAAGPLSLSPAQPSGPSSFVLSHIDVYNWGAFGLRHSAEIDPAGTAVIGPTGSGKTTLIDALMTLITANPRYNLASTGGHESDRDLVSYVRGVSGAGNNSGDNEHVARPGNVVSGISARFDDGTSVVRLGALFWFDGTSSATTDLKRRWIFCVGDGQTLDGWLETHHAGGVRALKALEGEIPGLKIHDSKQAYLARLRDFFDVGENAFNLLNRAAGLKQLSSIDEVFRELVLDDHSAFDRALEVAKEFDDLAAIHEELETARRQRDSLLPVEAGSRARTVSLADRELQRELQGIVSRWFAHHAARLWREEVGTLDRRLEACNGEQRLLAAVIERDEIHAGTLQTRYLQVGGANIEHVQRQIAQQESTVDQRRRFANDYRRLTQQMGLGGELSAAALAANKGLVEPRTAALQAQYNDEAQHAWSAGALLRECENRRKALQEEIDEVSRRPGSNVPADYQRFRRALAQHLGRDEDALPFVAELVEVKSDQALRWRGAIERAIGGHRLRVMVPVELIESALSWLNATEHRLYVRLLEVATSPGLASFFDDGYVRKLNFKTHPHREAVKQLMARIDRHCVDTPQLLRGVAYAMTDRGVMSDQKGYYEKRGEIALDRDWTTGFDNKDRLATLTAGLQQAESQYRDYQAQAEAAQAAADTTRTMIELLTRLANVEFDDIDLPGAQRELDETRRMLHELTAPDSDAAVAKAAWERAVDALKRQRAQERELEGRIQSLNTERVHAMQGAERAQRQLGDGLNERQQALAEGNLTVPDAARLSDFADLERKESNTRQSAIDALNVRLKEIETGLVRNMEKAQKVDRGDLAEIGTELADVPQYLERLRVLEEEALPEKLQRFLRYLNQSSDQGVTQLLSDIDNEVSTIEERIEDLNRTLRRVDFQPSRYLRLDPQRVVHQSLHQLHQAMRHLRAAALSDDQGESEYRALRSLVDHLRDHADKLRRTLGAKALLDPRYRLQFAISVIDRATGSVIETRTSSQGGSGGEKEIIASYVLTASLSYALCPKGGNRPLFGTIVLDEAFSKSSVAVAGRIIRALDEFGLHTLFVTPNKELRLLRQHTRSAILIHRKGARATMTTLSWEELDRHAEQRKQRLNEVAG